LDSLLDHLCRFTVPAAYMLSLESFLESLLPSCVKSPYGSLYCLRSAELRICLQSITFRIQRAFPSARLNSAPLSFLRHISRQETLVFRCESFSLSLSLLMPTFAFLFNPQSLTTLLLLLQNAPLPTICFHIIPWLR